MEGGKHNGGTNTGIAESLLLVETNTNNQRDAKTRKLFLQISCSILLVLVAVQLVKSGYKAILQHMSK